MGLKEMNVKVFKQKTGVKTHFHKFNALITQLFSSFDCFRGLKS